VLNPVLLALALGAGGLQAPPREVVADIRVHGNVLTPDEEVRDLAGLEVGAEVTPDLVGAAEARLRAARRFDRVEVLKRFASIADPTQIALVVIVDEGAVRIEPGDGRDTPARVVRRRGLRLMYLPVLSFEDGYGLAYGARIAHAGAFGSRSRIAFPLTWGGDKRAAAEVDKVFARGPVSRIEAGVSASRRTHPHFDADDDRQRVWATAERQVTSSLRVGGTAGWQRVALLDADDRDQRRLAVESGNKASDRVTPLRCR
jgi:hypothetical protein